MDISGIDVFRQVASKTLVKARYMVVRIGQRDNAVLALEPCCSNVVRLARIEVLGEKPWAK